jgi:hypothetical protein
LGRAHQGAAAYGGWQEGRGGPLGSGAPWYIENSLALLDAPGEWHYDHDGGRLYLYPNETQGGGAPSCWWWL